MQLKHSVHTRKQTVGAVAAVLGTFALALLPCGSAHAEGTLADRLNGSGDSPAISRRLSSDYQPAFHLDYLHRGSGKDCQVPLPPVGAISPFPLSLRLGAMLSPNTAFDGGIDANIPGLHLLPGFSSRVDVDAIVSAHWLGVSTLVPATFDQIYNLNLPISTKVYAGGGIGAYFSNNTRFGGKLILGAQFSRLGVEGNLHFAGIGDPLFTLQARIGL